MVQLNAMKSGLHCWDRHYYFSLAKSEMKSGGKIVLTSAL